MLTNKMDFSCYDILAKPVINISIITDIDSVDKITTQFDVAL